MLKYKEERIVDVSDWDALVKETYGKPYSFQQQDGCQSRGMFGITIPSEWAEEAEKEMNDSIPEKINGDEMGVKFPVWLARDPLAPVDGENDYSIGLFWDRNFYPNIYTIANDMYKKGLIEKGDYFININW